MLWPGRFFPPSPALPPALPPPTPLPPPPPPPPPAQITVTPFLHSSSSRFPAHDKLTLG